MNTVPARIFISCKFPNSTNTYTYHSDLSELLVPGDRVIVNGRGYETEVEVVEVDVPKPNFTTKPILRKVKEVENGHEQVHD